MREGWWNHLPRQPLQKPQVGSRRGETLQSLPLLSIWWLISVSNCFKDTLFFSRISWEGGLMWGGEERQDQPIHRGEGWLHSEPRSQKLMDPARQGPEHISLNKEQIRFLMKHSPHFSDWRLLHSFNIWYLSIAINFSCPFSPFNEAKTENQQYYYSLLRNISICKRLTNPQDSQQPSPTLKPRNVF